MELTFKQKAAYGIGAVGKDMVYALFAAPDLSEAGLMVYFTVVYILWGVTYNNDGHSIRVDDSRRHKNLLGA